MADTVQIDGSFGEGGGQIIRTSLSLASMTGRPVEIFNIRARRTKPGLQPQHLTAVFAAAELCDARLKGAAVGSTAISFVPQSPPRPDQYRFDIGTAGATGLVAQTVLLPLSHTGKSASVEVIGGTHVPHAPMTEYLEAVYVPALRLAGAQAQYGYATAGFYPRGGGRVSLRIGESIPDRPLTLIERGKLGSLKAYVVTANLPEHVAERGEGAVHQALKEVGRQARVEVRRKESPGIGAAVLVAAECENGLAGFSALGERGKPMERVAADACEDFLRWWKSGAACDEHLADQLVLPMALAKGESRWSTPEVTEHLRTVLWVAQQFLPIEYSLDERPEGGGTVTLRGVG